MNAEPGSPVRCYVIFEQVADSIYADVIQFKLKQFCLKGCTLNNNLGILGHFTRAYLFLVIKAWQPHIYTKEYEI